MKTTAAMTCCALSVCVAAASLSACAGHSTTVIPSSASVAQVSSGATQRALRAAKETVLYAFKGGSRGAGPTYGVIANSAGALLGTTSFGGGPKGFGTIFELTPSGDGYKEATLHDFTRRLDGVGPSGLAGDSSGNFYGATLVGGYQDGCLGGCGLVFKLTRKKSGYNESVIYRFAGGTDAAQPVGTPVLDKSGNIYGVTQTGGLSNNGAVFKLAPSSLGYTESVLYSLPGGGGGSSPQAGLTIDSKGTLYGTTDSGGDLSACGGAGCGVVFKLMPPNYTPTTLYAFRGPYKDGDAPYAAPTVDNKTGTIYGTTEYGGAHNLGSVFELAPDGSGYQERVVYSFPGSGGGALPESQLLLTPNGRLFGTATLGPVCVRTPYQNNECGLIFKLTPSGSGYSYATVYAFPDPTAGADPASTTLWFARHALFGTTTLGGVTKTKNCFFGGPNGCGVVFRLVP